MHEEVIDCDHFDEAAWLLISGELDNEARISWQRHIAGCGGCASLLAQRRGLLDVYDGIVTDPEPAVDVSRLPVTRRRRLLSLQPAMAIAAGLLLLILGALADRMASRGRGDVDALHNVQRRLNDLEVQLAVARIDQPTAAERLTATAAGIALAQRNPRMIDALLDAVETDPSPNVRMAVIEALYTIESTTRVRERFDTLLAEQASPMLRVALIELAADRGFVETVGTLKRVAAEAGDETVRQRARWAIRVLTQGA
jgi:rRNA-processing protein FCF1